MLVADFIIMIIVKNHIFIEIIDPVIKRQTVPTFSSKCPNILRLWLWRSHIYISTNRQSINQSNNPTIQQSINNLLLISWVNDAFLSLEMRNARTMIGLHSHTLSLSCSLSYAHSFMLSISSFSHLKFETVLSDVRFEQVWSNCSLCGFVLQLVLAKLLAFRSCQNKTWSTNNNNNNGTNAYSVSRSLSGPLFICCFVIKTWPIPLRTAFSLHFDHYSKRTCSLCSTIALRRIAQSLSLSLYYMREYDSHVRQLITQ